MRNLHKYFLTLFVAVLIGISTSPSFADHDGHEHITTFKTGGEIIVQPNEAVIVVHGIVCSFCSQGVTKKLSKLSFIDPSKYTDGVKVEIESQRVTVAVKPNTDIDFKQIFASIKSGGYEPIKAYTADGETITPEDK